MRHPEMFRHLHQSLFVLPIHAREQQVIMRDDLAVIAGARHIIDSNLLTKPCQSLRRDDTGGSPLPAVIGKLNGASNPKYLVPSVGASSSK